MLEKRRISLRNSELPRINQRGTAVRPPESPLLLLPLLVLPPPLLLLPPLE